MNESLFLLLCSLTHLIVFTLDKRLDTARKTRPYIEAKDCVSIIISLPIPFDSTMSHLKIKSFFVTRKPNT